MTSRGELSRSSEPHSLTGQNNQADTSPAGLLRLARRDMVPSLVAEPVAPPAALPAARASTSRLSAQDWIRGFHVAPATDAGTLVVARPQANPSESGLLEVATAGDVAILMPDVTVNNALAGIGQSRSGLTVVNEVAPDVRLRTGSGSLVLPTDADTKKYGKGEENDEKDTTPRSPSEIAVAFETPHHFLAREIRKRLPEHDAADFSAVVAILDSDKANCKKGTDRRHMFRKITVKKYTRVVDGEERSYGETTPGAFERVSLMATDLLDDPEITPQADQVVFKPLIDLAKYYRWQFGFKYGLPEMPELTNTLIERLDQFPEDKQARVGMYGLLQQLQMPSSVRDKVAKKMYELNDLDIPWATNLGHPFVSDLVADRLGDDLSEDMAYMLTALKQQNKDLTHGDFVRASVLKRDWLLDENDQIIGKKPGELEEIGITIVDALTTPDLPPHADEHMLLSLSRLMRDFRLHSTLRTHYQFALPEMPDLTDALIKKLSLYPTEQRMRNRIYGILEQVTLPVTDQEALIAKMDAAGDLDHPLAFILTHNLSQTKPDAKWIKTQTERRNALYERLSGSNQELFEDFDKLLALSRGLVFSGNPLSARYGKIGLEIEMQQGRLIDDEMDHKGWRKDVIAREKGLDEMEWDFGIDGSGLLEVRRANLPASLWHNSEYISSLLTLYRWIGDYAASVESMHLHVDRSSHPRLPVLGHMLDGHTRGRIHLVNSAVAPSIRHRTYEIRGINPPQGFGNVHPGRIEDVINLYISASQTDTKTRTNELLTVSPTTEKPTVKQLTWGHIVTFLSDPGGRLAALMALHDEVALRNVNPLSFANSFDKDSVLLVLSAIEGKFTHASDLEMIEALRLFATSDTWQEAIKAFDNAEIMHDVLGLKYARKKLLVQEMGEGFELQRPLPSETAVVTLDMQMDTLREENNTRHERVEGTGERIHTRRRPEYDRLHYQIRGDGETPVNEGAFFQERVRFETEDNRRNELPDEEEQIQMQNILPPRGLTMRDMVAYTRNAAEQADDHAGRNERQENLQRFLRLRENNNRERRESGD